MSLSELTRHAGYYLALGAIAAAALAALFMIGYFLLYKKLFRGKKRIKPRTALLFVLSACYLVSLLGAVLLRGGVYGEAVLTPFASYAQAWARWSIREWRNIVLNVALFVPFGFLLPLWGAWFRRFWRTALCGFLFTLAVELAQLVTRRGIFETDDLIGNTLGVLIGFGLSMLFLAIVHKEKLPAKKIFGYLAPLLLACAAFFGILAAYHMKELGNVSYACGARVAMAQLRLSSNTELSDEETSAPIYRLSRGKSPEAIAEAIFAAAGTAIDKEQTIFYDESTYYYAKDRGIILSVSHVEGEVFSYHYIDFSRHDSGQTPLAGAEEGTVRAALAKLGQEPPEGCDFYDQGEGAYIFTASMLPQGDNMLDGRISCAYYADGTVKDIGHSLFTLEPYREVRILSEAEAYKKLETGAFTPPYSRGGLAAISVEGTSLSYTLDTKGFYQPVYSFACVCSYGDEELEADIGVPAMR